MYAEPRVENNFAFSMLLANVFNAYLSVNKIEKEEYNYSEYCSTLSEELFLYARNLRGGYNI